MVPKGLDHKPHAEKECKIMLVEPVGTINTGNAGGDLTAEDNVWILIPDNQLTTPGTAPCVRELRPALQ